MKQNMKVKLSLIISMVGLLCLVVGSSYAILQDSKEGETKQIINVGKVKLKLTESKNGLNLDNLTDMTDEEGFSQNEYYSFSVSNIGDAPAEYDLLLIKDETKTNTLDERYIKIGLIVNGERIKVVNLKDVNNIIHSTIIDKDEDINYTLRIWLDPDSLSDGEVEADSTINLKLKVDAVQYLGDVSNKNTFYNIMKSQVQTKAISYQYINDAKQTINGITYNDGDNGVFLFDGTDDNGGTYPIYYYRGNVTNNNVLFANLCWKIVRTTSTGGTKLIYNGTPTDGKCNATGTDTQIGKSKFNNKDSSQADVGYMYGTRYTNSNKNMSSITDTYMYGNDVTYSNGTYTLSGKTTTSVGSSWNTDRTTLANGYHYTCLNSTGTCTSVYYITYFGNSSRMYYLTFTGGDTLETAKTKMFSNTNDSAIKTYIDDWYNAHLTDYTSYLENTIFCNDRSFTEETMYAEEEWAMSVDGGPMLSKDTNSTTYSFFGGTGRLFAGKPSLTCPRNEDKLSLSTTNGGTSGYGNNTLTYPVGMLTYDEAMLAGGQTSSNKNYYLYTGQAFWLLSPSGWYDNCANVGRVYSDALVGNSYVDGPDGVRPSVSLQPGTLFLEGEGTMNNPYVVTEYVQLPQ